MNWTEIFSKSNVAKIRRTKIQKEMNNTLEGLNSKITEAEEQISDLEDRMVEISAAEENIERRMIKIKIT